MKEQINALADAIKASQLHADKFKETLDGGSCNLDTVIYDFTGWRQPSIRRLESMTGLSIGDKMNGIYSGYRFIFFNTEGQADLRSKMVVEAKNKMCELGHDCQVWYYMD